MPETATVQITMPEMGESVTEGIVLEWHVAEGDMVSEGDTVVEVSTDKVDAEVPAPMDGVITKLVARWTTRFPWGRRWRRWRLVGVTARDRPLGPRVLSPIPGSPSRGSPRNRRHPRVRPGQVRVPTDQATARPPM